MTTLAVEQSALESAQADFTEAHNAWRELKRRSRELEHGELDGKRLDEIDRTVARSLLEQEQTKLAATLAGARNRLRAAKIADANEQLAELESKHAELARNVLDSRLRAERAYAVVLIECEALRKAQHAEGKQAQIMYRAAGRQALRVLRCDGRERLDGHSAGDSEPGRSAPGAGTIREDVERDRGGGRAMTRWRKLSADGELGELSKGGKLEELDILRVDAVASPATGHRWAIIKSEADPQRQAALERDLAKSREEVVEKAWREREEAKARGESPQIRYEHALAKAQAEHEEREMARLAADDKPSLMVTDRFGNTKTYRSRV